MDSKPQLRWYQFGLRTLLVLFLLTALAAAAVKWRISHLEFMRRREAALSLLSERFPAPLRPDFDASKLSYLNLDSRIYPEELYQVTYFPKLQWLKLGRQDFDAQHLNCLKQLPELEILEVRGGINGGITEAGFAELGQLRRLKVLRLSGTNISPAGIEQLGRIPHLRELEFSTENLSECCRNLGRCRQLEKLSLSSQRFIRPGDLGFLKEMPKLRSFHLEALLEGDVLRDLSHVPQLSELVLQYYKLSNQDLRHIESLAALRYLSLEAHYGNLYDNSVTDAGLQSIGKLRELRFLNLNNCRGVTDSGLPHLSNLQQLRSLRLSGTSISDLGIPTLKELSKLEVLSLQRTAVTPKGVEPLAGLPNLQVLDVPWRPSIPEASRGEP